MGATAEIGRNPVSKHHRFSLSVENEQNDAERDGRTRLARPNSQARTGQGNMYIPCSADHEQDWQPDPVDPCFDIDDDYFKLSHIDTYVICIK